MISFRKLWILLEQKKISQYKLIYEEHFSKSTLERLRKNQNVETITIERICNILDCQPGDIMENLPANKVERKEPSFGKGGRKPKI